MHLPLSEKDRGQMNCPLAEPAVQLLLAVDGWFQGPWFLLPSHSFQAWTRQSFRKTAVLGQQFKQRTILPRQGIWPPCRAKYLWELFLRDISEPWISSCHPSSVQCSLYFLHQWEGTRARHLKLTWQQETGSQRSQSFLQEGVYLIDCTVLEIRWLFSHTLLPKNPVWIARGKSSHEVPYSNLYVQYENQKLFLSFKWSYNMSHLSGQEQKKNK